MDNPEIKALLKSAKEAIKNKDAKEALKLCKSVIDKDKENYLGWVMTGAAANELNNKDQALAAYQRAIQISGNQAPAWQGLAQLYEKSNSQSELISVYNELRKFFSNDAVKYFDISNKYANCLLSQSKTKEAISVLYELVKNQNTDKNYAPVIENLARLLALSDEQTSSVYFDVIHVIDQNSQIKIENELLEKINENALKSMIKAHESWKKILDHLFDLLENHSPQNQFALITLFEIYSEALISSTQIEQKYLTKIEQLLQEETNKSDCIEQYRILINAVNMLPNLDHNNITEFKKNLDHGKIEQIIRAYLS